MSNKPGGISWIKKFLRENPYGFLARLFFALTVVLAAYIVAAMNLADYADQYVSIFHFMFLAAFVGLAVIFILIRIIEKITNRLKENHLGTKPFTEKPKAKQRYGQLSVAALVALFLMIYFGSPINFSADKFVTGIIITLALLVILFSAANVKKSRTMGSVVLLIVAILLDCFLAAGYLFVTYIFD